MGMNFFSVLTVGPAIFRFIIMVEEMGGKLGRKEMFHLTTHSTHFIYGYLASDI